MSDVVHESGRHYVVRLTEDRRGRAREAYEVRRAGIVTDKRLALFSGGDARARACAEADRLAGEDSR